MLWEIPDGTSLIILQARKRFAYRDKNEDLSNL